MPTRVCAPRAVLIAGLGTGREVARSGEGEGSSVPASARAGRGFWNHALQQGALPDFCAPSVRSQRRGGVADACGGPVRGTRSLDRPMLPPSSDHPPPPATGFPKTRQLRCLELSLLLRRSSRLAGCPRSPSTAVLFGWAAGLVRVTLPAWRARPRVCGCWRLSEGAAARLHVSCGHTKWVRSFAGVGQSSDFRPGDRRGNHL